jgi:DNA polymerase III subunit gamma/tau
MHVPGCGWQEVPPDPKAAMSYQVLARKWRPRTFREMVGQGHVLQTLIHALDNQRLHHAYLFTGTRGVGKTTIARILARCLNCEGGITSTPCGQCLACREINEGRFLDLIEVDAASRTKVEDTRELLENVQYAPSRGRFKIYLIDEVHMLSNHSFNALLKTLEEPPPHVKFLLATTDPQKLPVTVLSRCLQFSLKNLSPEKLVEHMKHILTEEGLAFEEPALWALGRAAQGSVRDCLTLLDQAIGFCKDSLTAAAVGEFLGSIDQAVIAGLMQALIAKDAAELLRTVRSAAENSPDFAAVLQELLSWLHRVAIAQAVPDAIDNSQGDREAVLAHAAALSPENLQLYYQIALKGREDLPFAPSAQSGLEMTLLRMLAFTPQTGLRSSVPSPAGDLAAAGQKKKLTEPGPAPPATAPNLQEATSAALAGKPLALTALSAETWPLLFAQLGLSGVTRSVASHCCVQRVRESDIELTLDANNAALFNEEHRRRIETALREYFRQEIVLVVTPGRCAAETPAARRLRLEDERRLAAVQDFTHDPVVKALVERFGAEVQYDTIVPLTPQRH